MNRAVDLFITALFIIIALALGRDFGYDVVAVVLLVFVVIGQWNLVVKLAVAERIGRVRSTRPTRESAEPVERECDFCSRDAAGEFAIKVHGEQIRNTVCVYHKNELERKVNEVKEREAKKKAEKKRKK